MPVTISDNRSTGTMDESDGVAPSVTPAQHGALMTDFRRAAAAHHRAHYMNGHDRAAGILFFAVITALLLLANKLAGM